MAVSHLVAGTIDTHRAETIFDWIIPIGLIVAMVKYMGKVRAEGKPAPPADQPAAPS
jgi:hypothetical protein